MADNLASAAVNKLKRSEKLSERSAEVSPGEFVKYKQHDLTWDLENGSFTAVHSMENEKRKFWQTDIAFIEIAWKDRKIQWVGAGVPISLRVWKGNLHMIVFDRDTDFSKIRFRYYREKHDVLTEIDARDYPPEIATQNLWLKADNGTRMDGTASNEYDTTRELNPKDVYFRRSLTAKIWAQIETGKEFYELDVDIDESVLQDFLKKHAVERLKLAVPTAETRPAK